MLGLIVAANLSVLLFALVCRAYDRHTFAVSARSHDQGLPYRVSSLSKMLRKLRRKGGEGS